MKLNTSIKLNLKTKEASDKVKKAAGDSLKETTVAIAADVVKGSPVRTGNNRRSIQYGLQEGNLQAEVFSTSGYGGFLETGTSKMAARPYFKPALDQNFNQEKFSALVKSKL
jgi:HK97 gp10 family phage protein